MILFHGTEDRLVPIANSRSLRDQLEAQGNRCELVELPGQPHGVGGPEQWAQIFSLLHPFLRETSLLPS